MAVAVWVSHEWHATSSWSERSWSERTTALACVFFASRFLHVLCLAAQCGRRQLVSLTYTPSP